VTVSLQGLVWVRRIARRYGAEMKCYWQETASVADFLRLMRVRLSLSKVGGLACRAPIVVDVRVASLGGAIRLRSHTTDISVLKELVIGRTYDSSVERAQGRVHTIVDLGANTGLAARLLLNRYPGAAIVCVEPDPDNAALLRQNLEQAPCGAQIVQACVGAHERRVKLASSTGAWGYTMEDLDDGDGNGDVEVVALERILNDAGIEQVDVLKCDIEGAEREVFAACGAWIDRVRLAMVECHDGLNGDALLRLIEANGGHFEILARRRDDVAAHELVTLHNTSAT
jgi:FkbM family methyltransferase